MSKEPLDPSQEPAGQSPDESRVLNIGNLHLHANDIDALRRLSETDPELARLVVDQEERFDRREHASYRFGISASLLLILSVILALSYVLVKLGIILSLILLAVLFAVALAIRVILTGEWSDTSVIGKIVDAIIRSLGGKPRD